MDLRSGAACCLLVPWCQPVYSLASIHFQSFIFFLVFSLLFTVFFGVLNDFVLFLPFLDVFLATCIHVITSGMDGSFFLAVGCIRRASIVSNKQAC